ncbi:biotin--[acetyl-CoA-carboxylase] ligase [Vampirovibrio chlorellavorus]|uniref:biotin--[acetyl-CoA-carboxylase] ligase n=1 Tax=Vampirovibrio chlorellavorus TaxID=758823 RepID=UPI0026EAC7AD|nr:biotin--[acetyl-CoA-carboxylase] ligase [Vampirovibrio chlorellavorus]
MFPQTRFHYIEAPELDSTNEEARRLLQAEALSGPAIIRAHQQTAGRGTQGRTWHSPAGAGLYFSVVHPFAGWVEVPPALVPITPLFTLAAGVACAESVRDLTGLELQLKPINDLCVNGQKLGGILVESLISQNQCQALITGIGINVFEQDSIIAACLEEGRGNQPISLQACIPPHHFEQFLRLDGGQGQALMRELCDAIAGTVDDLYRALILGEHRSILARYRECQLPGTELRIPPTL